MDELDKRRFLEKVDITDACWNWTAQTRNGYGVFWLNRKGIYAHRAVYEHVHGPVPVGMFVCHHCDNPGCVNPKHLFLGTTEDNSHDSVKKSRQAFSERHGKTKLTEKEVLAMRDSNEPYSVIAERYGIAKGSVSNIRTGRNWKYLDGAVEPRR